MHVGGPGGRLMGEWLKPLLDQATARAGRLRTLMVGDSVTFSLVAGFDPRATAGLQPWATTTLGCALDPYTEVVGSRRYEPGHTCTAARSAWPLAARLVRPDVAIVMPGAGEMYDRVVRGDVAAVGSPAYRTAFDAQLDRAVRDAGATTVAVMTTPCRHVPDSGTDPQASVLNDAGRLATVNDLVAGSTRSATPGWGSSTSTATSASTATPTLWGWCRPAHRRPALLCCGRGPGLGLARPPGHLAGRGCGGLRGDAVRVDPRVQRRAAEWLARHGWRVQRTVDGRPNPAHLWDDDRAFAARYAAVRDLTLVTPAAAYVLDRLATQALQLAGDFAEVGVYQGGSARLLADLLRGSDRPLHLFDTFTGMPPTDLRKDMHREGDFGDTSLAAVRRLLADNPSTHLHAGLFPETAAPLAEHTFALVHVDVDIYRSVLDCCAFFYPRLVPGGFLLVDDYGWTSCPGARAAVDEFFADTAEQPVYLPTGQALVVRLP